MSRQSTEVVILGLPVTTLSMGGVIQTIAGWIEHKQSRRVCACDVHSVVRALDDERHGHALGTADLLLPDGVPLVRVGRFRGSKHMQRVCNSRVISSAIPPVQPSGPRLLLIPIALLAGLALTGSYFWLFGRAPPLPAK